MIPLITLMQHVLDEVVNEDNPMDTSINQGTGDLCACYKCLSDSASFAADRLAKHSDAILHHLRRAGDFCGGSTFTSNPNSTCSKSCREESLPGRSSASETCRDQEFGGSMMGVTRSRGKIEECPPDENEVPSQMLRRIQSLGRLGFEISNRTAGQSASHKLSPSHH